MPAPVFDAESLLDTILEHMTAGGALNAKIAEIEAEKVLLGKGLDPTLAPIAAGSYYEQTWTDGVLNTAPSIFYGIEEVSVLDGGGATAKTYDIFVEIVLVDSGQTSDFSKRINRYARALEELFLSVFAAEAAMGSIKIKALRPISFKLELDSSEEVKVGGVTLTVNVV
jgi:hypothetical protein